MSGRMWKCANCGQRGKWPPPVTRTWLGSVAPSLYFCRVECSE